jgi:uncharacterized protein
MALQEREARAELVLEGGTGRIAVVADTHSRPHHALTERLAELRPAAIFHAGDIGDLAVLDQLAEHAPVYAVRGNIDVHAPDLPDLATIDVRRGSGGGFRVLLVHIGVAGARLRADVARKARALGADLVVCGHSHVPFIGVDRGLTVLNPGSAGPRRFTLPIVFATIEVTPDGLALAHVACETGARWTPP